MASARTLHGGCQCGRNVYIVQLPAAAAAAGQFARVLFDPAPSHRASLASPLPTYLRVPLAWYHSRTQAYFPDETPAVIHRAYEHALPLLTAVTAAPSSSADDDSPTAMTRRHFCGFCGTPLSFWSEVPRTEAEYIRLPVGSLRAEDLDDLDEWATATSSSAEEEDNNNNEEDEGEEAEQRVDAPTQRPAALSPRTILSSTGLPWFDSFVEGSRLGRHLLQQRQRQQSRQLQHEQQLQRKHELQPTSSSSAGGPHIRRHDYAAASSADGTVQVEWEVLEWTEGDDEEDQGEAAQEAQPRSSEQSPAKRARLGGSGTGAGEEDEAAAVPMDVEK